MASPRLRFPDRLDGYVLRLLAPPFVVVLATLLVTQLLERLLRLMQLSAANGTALLPVLAMLADLVPHYLGLALPAAFGAGMFVTVARLSDDSELDVMLASGRSITRLAMPFFALAIGLSAFSFYLFGWMQPLGRYAFHAAVHDASQASWDARVEENRFVRAARGSTLTADSVDEDGRGLHGVFVQRSSGKASETTTARHGRLVPAADGRRLVLELTDGLIVREDRYGKFSLARFRQGVINGDFTPAPPLFRPRGASVRELTLGELRAALHGAPGGLPPSKLAGEFHGRLARSLVPLFLPLFAVPLGIASKRGHRAAGVVFACLALLMLDHSLQFGESLAESGRFNAAAAVWTPLLAFVALGAWIFRGSLAWPGDNPINRAVLAVEGAFMGIRALRRRR